MRLVLVYQGVKYYLLKELLAAHPRHSHITERMVLKEKIFSFYGNNYITSETWEEIEHLIEVDELYYNQTELIEKYQYGLRDVERHVLAPLSRICAPRMIDGHPYYARADVDKIGTLSLLYSSAYGVNVIVGYELVRYHNSCKNNNRHNGNLYISQAHLRYLYPRELLITINGLLCIKSDNIQDPYADFNYRCSHSDEITSFECFFGQVAACRETYRMMRKFFLDTINRSASSSRKQYASYLTSLLYQIYSQLNKELFLYSKSEVESSVLSDPVLSGSKDIIHFLSYVSQEHPTFSNGASYKIKARSTQRDYDNVLLSPSEFAILYAEAIRVDRHVEAAYNNHAYAQYWLCTLFHLSNFIRASDIFNLPIIELYKEFPWGYFCDNEISDSDAEIICQLYAAHARTTLIGKTKSPKRIYYLHDQAPALAIALIICIGHAKKRNLPKLFSMKQVSADRIFNKLGPPFSNISNRRLNYTLATYFEAAGNEAGEFRNNVYSLLSIMRSHKTDSPLSHSDATSKYIKADNRDNSVSDIAFHTFQRGAFGWVYSILLRMAGEKFDSLESETDQIRALQHKYSPNDLELLSDYVSNEQIARTNALHQLAVFTPGEIRTFLGNIGICGTFKSRCDLPCIFGKNCPHPGADCLYCELSVKTIHALFTYQDELMLTLQKIRVATSESEIKKLSFLLLKILSVFRDAGIEFGSQFSQAFIDQANIKEQLKTLPPHVLRILKEVKDDQSPQPGNSN